LSTEKSIEINHLHDIVVGNIIGSNIANIGLILGLSAIVQPLGIDMKLLYREMPIMVGISGLLYFMGWDGILSRQEGCVLLAGILAYTCYVYRVAIKESTAVEKGYAEYLGKKYNNISEDIFWIAIGLGGLIGGAYLLVHSAVYIARVIGISELVICLTVIAVGTSLPELGCCDTKRIRYNISVGNVLGSNIFNILAILDCCNNSTIESEQCLLTA